MEDLNLDIGKHEFTKALSRLSKEHSRMLTSIGLKSINVLSDNGCITIVFCLKSGEKQKHVINDVIDLTVALPLAIAAQCTKT